MGAVDVRDHRLRCDGRGGQLDRAGGPAGQLGTDHRGGLAAGRGGGDLVAWPAPPVPATAAGLVRVTLPVGDEEPGAYVADTAEPGAGAAGGGDGGVAADDQLDRERALHPLAAAGDGAGPLFWRHGRGDVRWSRTVARRPCARG